MTYSYNPSRESSLSPLYSRETRGSEGCRDVPRDLSVSGHLLEIPEPEAATAVPLHVGRTMGTRFL